MKVGYLLHWNEGEKSGVFKKVISQIRAWQDQETEVSLHVVSRHPMLELWQRYLKDVPITIHIYRDRGISRLRAWKEAAEALKAQHPDVVYRRYDIYMPAVNTLSREVPVILEINTDDFTEYCLAKGLRCIYNRLTRSFQLSRVAGLVFVTQELAHSPHFRKYRKPYTVIPNGIYLSDYYPLPPAHNQKPKLIFLGTDRHPWHGVDKIVRMARLFPQWQFEIVGIQPSSLNDVPNNVHIYGYLDRRAYEPLLAQADIAIGTLALHRIKMNEACTLKVREYLAYGLPVIIGYKDSDFIHGAPFILELPNTENNVETSTERIAEFVSKWKGRRVPRKAISHIDFRVKETQRLAFFKNVVEMIR